MAKVELATTAQDGSYIPPTGVSPEVDCHEIHGCWEAEEYGNAEDASHDHFCLGHIDPPSGGATLYVTPRAGVCQVGGT